MPVRNYVPRWGGGDLVYIVSDLVILLVCAVAFSWFIIVVSARSRATCAIS